MLVVGAYSTAIFALFYWLIDVRHWWRRTLFLRVIGINAITSYLAQKVVGFNQANKFLFDGLWSFLPAA